MDIKIQVALISAITSICVVLLSGIGKLFYGRYSLNYRLKREYEYEQRKNFQNELGLYKAKLLNSAEDLNHRLWNFIENRSQEWHIVDESEFNDSGMYYFHSFIYRLLVFFYWANKIEKETEYIDTTIATKSETNLLMLLKSMKLVYCDVKLFDGIGYDSNYAKDHFFRHDFESSLDYVANGDTVLSFEEFVDKISSDSSEINQWQYYMANISPSGKECVKYNVIICFHLMLIAFLNDYGYDFQKTSRKKVKHLISTYSGFKLKSNFLSYLKRNNVSDIKSVKHIVKHF